MIVTTLRGLILALFVTLLSPVTAQAHASLLSTTPETNMLSDAPPSEIKLTFSENVAPLRIELIAPDGSARDIDDAIANADVVTVSLADIDQRGTYVLNWRVASEDGHPVAGAFLFSVGEVSSVTLGPQTDPVLRFMIWGLRSIATASLFIGVGGALFVAFARLPGAARGPQAMVALGLLAVPLTLGLHGVDALGQSPVAIATAAPWQVAWSTSFGTGVLAAVVALALAWVSLRRSGGTALILAVLATVICATAFASTGHASAAAPQILMRPMVFVHALVLLFWIGALVPLIHALGTDNHAALQRFSDVIPFAVGLLLLSGATLAYVQLGPDTSTWPSLYGYILAAKLMVLAALFGLAAYNRWVLTDLVMAGQSRAIARLRSIVRVEVVLILLILCLAAGWRFAVPPRAVIAVVAQPVMLHLHTPKAMAMMTFSSDLAGPVSLDVELVGQDMAPIDARSVEMKLSNPVRGIENMASELTQGEDGRWMVKDLMIPLSGAWDVQLLIRVSRFELVTLDGTMTVR
jgi:copper transport protein